MAGVEIAKVAKPELVEEDRLWDDKRIRLRSWVIFVWLRWWLAGDLGSHQHMITQVPTQRTWRDAKRSSGISSDSDH